MPGLISLYDPGVKSNLMPCSGKSPIDGRNEQQMLDIQQMRVELDTAERCHVA
jgi:hypothetical protein